MVYQSACTQCHSVLCPEFLTLLNVLVLTPSRRQDIISQLSVLRLISSGSVSTVQFGTESEHQSSLFTIKHPFSLLAPCLLPPSCSHMDEWCLQDVHAVPSSGPTEMSDYTLESSKGEGGIGLVTVDSLLCQSPAGLVNQRWLGAGAGSGAEPVHADHHPRSRRSLVPSSHC